MGKAQRPCAGLDRFALIGAGTSGALSNYPEMATSIDKISLHAPDGYNVVVETPRGSRTKFSYDLETGLFRAKKLLAMGFAFPFPFPMGSLVRCRVLGGFALEDLQEGAVRRNDRLLAVPLLLHQDRPPYNLSDMPPEQLKDLEDFFVAYPAADGKQARVVGRLDKAEAENVIAKASL